MKDLVFIALLCLFQVNVANAQFCDVNDSDCDGTPDSTDFCPLDSFNSIEVPSCGCGYVNFDLVSDGVIDCVESCRFDSTRADFGLCSCPVLDILASLTGTSSAAFCPKFPTAQAKTVLAVAPTVVVMKQEDGTSNVQIFLQKFSSAIIKSKAFSTRPFSRTVLGATSRPTATKNTKLALRYQVVISSKDTGRALAKRVSKKNELTINGVAPGSYSVKYQVLGLDKRNKTVFRTRFSPGKDFIVS